MSALLLLLASCVRVSELYHHVLWRHTLWYPLTALPELLGLASLLCQPGLVARIGTADKLVPQPKVSQVQFRVFLDLIGFRVLWRHTLWYPLTALPELLGLASLLCRPGLVARIGTADKLVPQPKVSQVQFRVFLDLVGFRVLWRHTLWYPLTALPELLGLASLLCRPGLVARIGTADKPVPQPKARG